MADSSFFGMGINGKLQSYGVVYNAGAGGLVNIMLSSTGSFWSMGQPAANTTYLYEFNSNVSELITSVNITNATDLTTANDASATPDGNFWLTSNSTNAVCKISPAGTYLYAIPLGTTAPLSSLCVDLDSNVWVTNNGSNLVSFVSSAGVVLGNYTVAGATGIVIDEAYNMLPTRANKDPLLKYKIVNKITCSVCNNNHKRGLQ